MHHGITFGSIYLFFILKTKLAPSASKNNSANINSNSICFKLHHNVQKNY